MASSYLLDVDQLKYQALVLKDQAVRGLYAHYLKSSVWDLLRDLVFIWMLFGVLEKFYLQIWGYGIIASVKSLWSCISKKVFSFLLSLPFVKSQVDQQIERALEKVEEDMIDRSLTYYTSLPEKGWSESKVVTALEDAAHLKHADWEHGRLSGAVYHGGVELTDLQTEAFKRFTITNQLHPDAFPSLRKMDSEVVSMVLDLFNAPSTGCGTSTSGGTESLLLTCLAARQKAFQERGVTEPEIIAPVTIHAGFDKAAYYFKMKLVHVPVDPITLKADLKAVKRLINKNTVLLAGSAPNFPHGIIDDIQGLSKLAIKHKLPLHVDCCLGSFVVPFLSDAGVKNPPLFDFRLPGVTSISCDTHKYGFAPKGSSIIMYRDHQMRAYQYFISESWTGGLYGSPTLAGSRPGALMIACWATLMHIGKDGYRKHATDIVTTARKIRTFIEKEVPELYIMGDPIGSVVAFSSKTLNIYDFSDKMAKQGWHLNALQNPVAVHIACTILTVDAVDDLCKAIKETVADLVANGSTPSADGTAALYGVAGSIKTVGVAGKMVEGFLDRLYKV